MHAASLSLSAALPAMNWPPPREKVTMIGPPVFLAASMHALIDEVPTMLTPGIANSLSLAYCRRSFSAVPVTTPGLTVAGSFGKVLVSDAVADMLTGRRLANEPVKALAPAKKARARTSDLANIFAARYC